MRATLSDTALSDTDGQGSNESVVRSKATGGPVSTVDHDRKRSLLLAAQLELRGMIIVSHDEDGNEPGLSSAGKV